MGSVDVSGFGAVILAAGKGTRMKSDLAKVLHLLHGRPMISWVTACAASLVGEQQVVVVVGHQAEQVRNAVDQHFSVHYARQERLLGTGDAVRSALPALPDGVRDLLILCGDVPMIQARTLRQMMAVHRSEQNYLTLLSVSVDNPTGYGRVIIDDNRSPVAIREESDASDSEKKIKLINSGIYCVDLPVLKAAVDRLRSDNAQGEYYLTDIVAMVAGDGCKIGQFKGPDALEVMGVNTPADLEQAAAVKAFAPDELT